MNTDLLTDKYKNAELKIYTSISALSFSTGIDKKYFKIAKKRSFAGFCANNTVDWRKLKPVFDEEYDNLVNDAPDDIGHYKKEIAKREVKLKDLQIKKLEKGMLDPEDVNRMMIELATKQSVILKRIFGELPPRISGKSEPECKVILDKALQEIFDVLKDIV